MKADATLRHGPADFDVALDAKIEEWKRQQKDCEFKRIGKCVTFHDERGGFRKCDWPICCMSLIDMNDEETWPARVSPASEGPDRGKTNGKEAAE